MTGVVELRRDGTTLGRIEMLEPSCRVPGCDRQDLTTRHVWIGGEQVAVTFCSPHGAEYRIDEAR